MRPCRSIPAIASPTWHAQAASTVCFNSGSRWRTNLLQLHRLHARVLKLGKDAARLDRFMLAGVAYQQNAVVRVQAADKLVHLFGGRKRTLVHHIEPVFARIRPLASGKMGLQSLGLDTGLAQLLRRAARRRKTFDVYRPAPRLAQKSTRYARIPGF